MGGVCFSVVVEGGKQSKVAEREKVRGGTPVKIIHFRDIQPPFFALLALPDLKRVAGVKIVYISLLHQRREWKKGRTETHPGDSHHLNFFSSN